jgi:hypothetical protein
VHIDLIRDSASRFPALESTEKIRSMRIWHCKYKSLAPISECMNVEELVVANFPGDTLEALAFMRKLRYLSIVHMPKITNLGQLSGLSRLEVLSLQSSPSWDASGRSVVVESLDPIKKLSGLRHLELFGVCPPDKSLAPLEELSGLKSARFSQYPKAEIERFYRATGVMNQFNPGPTISSNVVAT